MKPSTLPGAFEDLEPFVDQWALEGSAERDRCRGASSEHQRDQFFQAMKERVGPALALLDQKPLDQLNDQERRLLNLVLSFAHVALAVEIQGKAEAAHTSYRGRMAITRSPADRPLPA